MKGSHASFLMASFCSLTLGCAPETEEAHRLDATLRCESEDGEAWLVVNVSADFEEERLRRKETTFEPDGIVGLEDTEIVALGTRQDGITSYDLSFTAEALNDRSSPSRETLEFSHNVACTAKREDVANHPDNAESIICISDDALCDIRVWREDANDNPFQL